ncbi:hypothetical protein PoB_005209900 [Plakobranchus ocellatus]|uniref:Uncharacterized protein n=1 Tax=Plakobranchus ocellatus TaxID=259542 RepID=A0AAV4BZC8_9GAST|nr:hypothetical protein PoB_005209900 [Plakobranchus ocellatus]
MESARHNAILDPFTENPTTTSNLESLGSQADSRRTVKTHRAQANYIHIIQIAEKDEITVTQEQPNNFKRQPDNVKKTISTRRAKRQFFNPIDMEMLEALKEPEKEDGTDGNWWRGLKPMFKELDPIVSLKFKHEEQTIFEFVEREKKKKTATRSIDLQIPHPLTAYSYSPWQPAHLEKAILQCMSCHRHTLVQARVPAVLTVLEIITNIIQQSKHSCVC